MIKLWRFFFGCKHEWKVIGEKTWTPVFGGTNRRRTYGCVKCGETAEKFGLDIDTWEFEQRYKGASVIDEENE